MWGSSIFLRLKVGGVVQRCARQFDVGGVGFSDRCLTHGAPGGSYGGPARRRPEKVQHAGGEEDEHPGVDDGVDGDEAQGNQVRSVRLCPGVCGVDVHPDLSGGEREKRGGVLDWLSGFNPTLNISIGHILVYILVINPTLNHLQLLHTALFLPHVIHTLPPC